TQALHNQLMMRIGKTLSIATRKTAGRRNRVNVLRQLEKSLLISHLKNVNTFSNIQQRRSAWLLICISRN
ncbi:MAG: hypothetical protein J6S49_04025, partial [Erysipelotrichaceae bacterium]|nr:hypothetical protein [Erysipelotrichaceae bacterium]